MIQSLCKTCSHRKEVVSGKGARFLLCEKSQTDRRFQKYPPQPIIECIGYVESKEDKGHSPDDSHARRFRPDWLSRLLLPPT